MLAVDQEPRAVFMEGPPPFRSLSPDDALLTAETLLVLVEKGQVVNPLAAMRRVDVLIDHALGGEVRLDDEFLCALEIQVGILESRGLDTNSLQQMESAVLKRSDSRRAKESFIEQVRVLSGEHLGTRNLQRANDFL